MVYLGGALLLMIRIGQSMANCRKFFLVRFNDLWLFYWSRIVYFSNGSGEPVGRKTLCFCRHDAHAIPKGEKLRRDWILDTEEAFNNR